MNGEWKIYIPIGENWKNKCYFLSSWLEISQNHGIFKVGKTLWSLSTLTSLLKGRSARANCSEPCPARFQVSASMKTPQLLYATCSKVWPPSQQKVFFFCLSGNSCISVCANCLWSCHRAPLRKVWFHLLSPSPKVFVHTDKTHSPYQTFWLWC